MRQIKPMTTEKEEQLRIKKLVKVLGGSVWDTSDYRAVHVTKGLPDLVIFLPGKSLMVWWETKSAQGMCSDSQLRFQEHCKRCNQHMGVGTFDDFKKFLAEFGYGFL